MMNYLHKIPPYAKPLYELQLLGKQPSNTLYMYIGKDAWKQGKISAYMRPTRTLVLPPRKSPLDYYWPVQGCDMFLWDTQISAQNYVDDVIKCLMLHGAIYIRYNLPNFDSIIYRREGHEG